VPAAACRLLARLDDPITELHVGQLGHLGSAKLRALVRLLALARRENRNTGLGCPKREAA